MTLIHWPLGARANWSTVDLFHGQGTLLDVWTLNAGTPGWRERLARALAAGVDVVTSDTPRLLAAAAREAF